MSSSRQKNYEYVRIDYTTHDQDKQIVNYINDPLLTETQRFFLKQESRFIKLDKPFINIKKFKGKVIVIPYRMQKSNQTKEMMMNRIKKYNDKEKVDLDVFIRTKILLKIKKDGNGIEEIIFDLDEANLRTPFRKIDFDELKQIKENHLKIRYPESFTKPNKTLEERRTIFKNRYIDAKQMFKTFRKPRPVFKLPTVSDNQEIFKPIYTKPNKPRVRKASNGLKYTSKEEINKEWEANREKKEEINKKWEAYIKKTQHQPLTRPQPLTRLNARSTFTFPSSTSPMELGGGKRR